MNVSQPPIGRFSQVHTDTTSSTLPGSEPAGDAAGGSAFQKMLGEARKLPPAAPIGAPLPSRKPDGLALLMATGQVVPSPPSRKPDPPPPDVELARTPAQTSQTALAALAAQAGAGEGESAAARLATATQRVARLSGHSAATLLAQARQESGLDPAARNRMSTAAGPFQFLDTTWLDLFRRHGASYGHGELARSIENRGGAAVVKDPAVRARILGLRHDVDVSAGMAARYLAEGREQLAGQLRRPVSEVESRIAYVMGVGGAAQLLRAAETTPDGSAADILPAAAQANQGLFYDSASGQALSARETVRRLSRRMETDHKDMFTAIARAGEPVRKLDAGSAPAAPLHLGGLHGTKDTSLG
jgi:hypothetical protein